jgi:hypothetical protein
MSVAVAARLGARLARYADALRLARKGEASLARLLGLARERLPALEPDEASGAPPSAVPAGSPDVWPVAVAAELDHALTRAVAALTPRPDDPLPASGDALRRAVRLAQDDGALDVRALARPGHTSRASSSPTARSRLGAARSGGSSAPRRARRCAASSRPVSSGASSGRA